MTQFHQFVTLCRRLEASPRRLDKLRLVAEFLRTLDAGEVGAAVAYLTGRPFPASEPRVLGVRGLPVAGPPPVEPSLTLAEVTEAFVAVADASGAGSRRIREERLAELAARATEDERALLARIIAGEMRTGVSDGLVLEAIGMSAGAELAAVRRAALFLGDLSAVAALARSGGAAALTAATPRLFVPLLPMLAELATDFDTVLAAHGGRTAIEYKYDGARIQLHRDGDRVAIWTRRRAVHPGRRGRRARRLPAAFALPGPHAAVPARARRRGAGAGDAARAPLLRLPRRRWEPAGRRALRATVGGTDGGHARPLSRPTQHSGFCGSRPRVLRAGAGRGARGRHGEGSGEPLRARRPGQAVVQAEGSAERGLRHHRRRPRIGPPRRLAVELSPGGARWGRLRRRRQDVQGVHGRPVPRDDGAPPGAGRRRQRVHGPGAPGDRGRGRLQRDPEEPDLSLRIGPALRAHHARARRQGAGAGDHAQGAADALRAAVRDERPGRPGMTVRCAVESGKSKVNPQTASISP